MPAGAQRAKAGLVNDGDTMSVTAYARGPVLRTTARLTVRLLEIDTPEYGRRYFREATAALRSLARYGSTVYVLADRQRRDRYGRWLLYVWNSGGRFVNVELVRRGLARVLVIPPNVRYAASVRAAERNAQSARRGLWGRAR